MNKDDIITINTTVKIQRHNVVGLENWLNDKFNLIDFKVIQDTDELYKNDKVFQKMVKNIKILNKQKQDYINKHN